MLNAYVVGDHRRRPLREVLRQRLEHHVRDRHGAVRRLRLRRAELRRAAGQKYQLGIDDDLPAQEVDSVTTEPEQR
jgi:hypothetical protein